MKDYQIQTAASLPAVVGLRCEDWHLRNPKLIIN